MTFRKYKGNTYTEAGWRICDRNECEIVPGPYMDTAPLRRGAPAIILGDFVRRYNAEIRKLTSPVWGWSAENSVPDSNHLGGVSVDVDAPYLPFGYYAMEKGMVARVRALVDSYGGAIKWGRDWSFPDEMHFQMGWPEGDKRYAAVIDKIRNNNVAEENEMKLTDMIKSAVDGKSYSIAYILGAMDFNVNKLGKKVQSLVDPKKKFDFLEMLQNIDLHSFTTSETTKKLIAQNELIIAELKKLNGTYQ